MRKQDDAELTTELTRRTFIAAGSAGLVAIGLGACGGGGEQGEAINPTAYSEGPASGGTPVRGGTLRVGVVGSGTSETINLLTALNVPDFIRIFALHDPLFFLAPRGTVRPALVEHAESNGDATLWTFQLRRGVVWHDGKDFDADDVVYTIKGSWGNPKNSFNAVLKTIVDFDGVRKRDSHTVEVPLKIGLADFPTVTVFPSCYVVQDGTKDFASGLGTGPFRFGSFKPGGRSEFSANRNYWQEGKPYVDSLVIDSSFATDSTRLNALVSGAVDIAPGVAPSLALAQAKSGRVVLGNQPGPGFVGPVCRVDKAPFNDARVREALKLIPNRPEYVKTVYNGFGAVSNDCPGATNKYWAKDLKRQQDLEKAKSLLKAAGQEDLTVTMATTSAYPGQKETATLFQEDARRAGVDVKLKEIPPAVYYTPAGGFFERPWSVTFYNTGVNSLAAFYLNAMLPGAPFNEAHWGGDERANRLLYEALGETDSSKAAEKWLAVQEIQFEQGPYIVAGTGNWLDAYSHDVRGVKTTPALSCNYFDFAGGWLVNA